MRLTLMTASLITLAACATPPPMSPAPTNVEVIAPVTVPSRGAQMLAAAGRNNAPTLNEIEHVLGSADLARQDGAGAALTYRLQSCALLLLFEADEQNALRLTEAHASARRAGEASPNLEQCVAEATNR